MVTAHQIMKGVGMWVDSEVLPILHGFPQYGVGVVSALLSRKGEKLLNEAAKNETVRALGLAQGDGFDLDILREVMVERFPSDGLRLGAEQINDFAKKFLGRWGAILNFQVQGGITFHRADLEKLFGYIGG